MQYRMFFQGIRLPHEFASELLLFAAKRGVSHYMRLKLHLADLEDYGERCYVKDLRSRNKVRRWSRLHLSNYVPTFWCTLNEYQLRRASSRDSFPYIVL